MPTFNQPNIILMKSTIFSIAIVLLFFGKSSSDFKTEILQHRFTTTFEGKINNKLSIIAKLEANNNDISGKYRYEGQTESLTLEGKFFNGDSLELKEFNSKGVHTGTFRGLYIKNKISGFWTSASGTKQIPFYMGESSADYDFINIAGKYGEMEIKMFPGNSIHVVVSMGSDLCEMGDVSGDFKWIENYTYKGTFQDYDDNATFILKYTNKEINLQQSPGEERVINGMHCYLEGTYKK